MNSAARYWHRSPFNPLRDMSSTPSQSEGSLYHSIILDRLDKDFAVVPEYVGSGASNSFRAWKRSQTLPIVKQSAVDAVNQNLAYLKAEIDSTFYDGDSEVSVFWVEGGIPCKARFDFLSAGRLVDIKSFSDTEHDIDQYLSSYFYRYGVHVQLAFYHRAAVSIGMGQVAPWVFFVNRAYPEARLKAFNKVCCPDMWRSAQRRIDKAFARFIYYRGEFGMYSAWGDDYSSLISAFDDSDFPQIIYEMGSNNE